MVRLQPHKPLSQSGSHPVRNLTQRRRRLLLSPRQRNQSPVNLPTRPMEMMRRRTLKMRTRKFKSPKARQQRERQPDWGTRRARPELHSSSQLVNPHQESNPQSHLQRVRRPWLSLWVLRRKLF